MFWCRLCLSRHPVLHIERFSRSRHRGVCGSVAGPFRVTPDIGSHHKQSTHRCQAIPDPTAHRDRYWQAQRDRVAMLHTKLGKMFSL